MLGRVKNNEACETICNELAIIRLHNTARHKRKMNGKDKKKTFTIDYESFTEWELWKDLCE